MVIIKLERSTCLNKGITFVDFRSVGKTPDTIDLLKMAQRELATRSAHSRRSCAKILSRLVTLDLQSLDNKQKTVQQSVVLSLNLC